MFAVRNFALTLRDSFRRQRAWLSRINAFLNENITGMAVVQLFNRQDRNLKRFDERNRGFRTADLKATYLLRRLRAHRRAVQRRDDRCSSSGTAAVASLRAR